MLVESTVATVAHSSEPTIPQEPRGGGCPFAHSQSVSQAASAAQQAAPPNHAPQDPGPQRKRTLPGVNLFDPELYQQGVPHELLRRLRAEAPVCWQEARPGLGYWAITRYEDIVRISKDPGTFSSGSGTHIQDWPEEDMPIIRMMMLNMDPPQHGKYRHMVRPGFTHRMVQKMEPHIRELVRGIVDRVAPLGECDFVQDIAAELPLQVIAELIGVPLEDRHLVYEWTNRMIGYDDAEMQDDLAHGRAAAMEMWQYANALAERRQREPGNDLVSTLLRGEVDGEKLTEMEFDAFFLLLAVAGNETTRNLACGGMLALIEHPAERARLLRDPGPGMMTTAVEEMLRWYSPLIYFRRTVLRDVVLGGQHLRAGERVAMYYPSANRDEAVFPDPQRFDVGRTPNPHLSFGIGEHHCLGANLARLEIRLLFEELLRRLPDIEPAGPLRRMRGNFVNTIKSMPVRFTPAAVPHTHPDARGAAVLAGDADGHR